MHGHVQDMVWNAEKEKVVWLVGLFFKQKTTYEIGVCLVGSVMCIRDIDKI